MSNPNIQELTENERKILAVLNVSPNGYTTGDVADLALFQLSTDRRTHSAGVRALLIVMEEKGLVGRMEQVKPIHWVGKVKVF